MTIQHPPLPATAHLGAGGAPYAVTTLLLPVVPAVTRRPGTRR
jgi:hypothetical protein